MIKEKTAIPNVPTLRFPEFAGEWENVRLGDTCEIQMCKRVLASQTSERGDVPFYKIGTIGNIPDAYISKELYDEYRDRYNYPKQGEILITCAGTVGKCLAFDGKDAYYQDSNIVWVNNPKQQIKNTFLYHYLSQVDWSKLNSTTITRIYNDNLRELKIFSPSHIEQTKIATFLSLLDDRIATQSQIIKELESLMKGLSNKLFSQELRFKDAQGNDFSDWKTTKLGSIMSLPEKIKPTFVDKNKLLTVKLHVNGVSKMRILIR